MDATGAVVWTSSAQGELLEPNLDWAALTGQRASRRARDGSTPFTRTTAR
jgi:hypothetical protein